MNDFLEIGFWRQRARRVERVLSLAEALEEASDAEADATIHQELADAVRAVREFDLKDSPWRRTAQQPLRSSV